MLSLIPLPHHGLPRPPVLSSTRVLSLSNVTFYISFSLTRLGSFNGTQRTVVSPVLVVIEGDSDGDESGGQDLRPRQEGPPPWAMLARGPHSDRLSVVPLPVAQGTCVIKGMCAPNLLLDQGTRDPGILCSNIPSLLPGLQGPLPQVCSLRLRDSLSWGCGEG